MKTRWIGWLVLLALFHSPTFGEALPGQKKLYRWVDEQGVVHFSDRMPAAHPAEVTQTALPATGSPQQAPAENPYSVENQLKHFEDARKAREAAKEKAQKVEEEAALRKAKIEAAKAEKAAAEREIMQRGWYWPSLPPPPPPQLPPPDHRPPPTHGPPKPSRPIPMLFPLQR